MLQVVAEVKVVSTLTIRALAVARWGAGFIAARTLFLAALLGAWAPSAHAGWQTFSTRDGLVSNSVTALFVDRAGRVWVGTQRGVSRFDGVTWMSYAAPDPLPLSRVNAITEDHEGSIWIGTDLGASRFDGAGWTHFESIGGVPSNPVKDILVDRAGGLWFATSLGGVTHFDGTSWTTYTTFHGFRHNNATAVYQDHEGTIWAAAYNIYRFGGASWAHVSAEETGSGEPNAVWIGEDASGRMWFAGENSHFLAWDRSTWTYHDPNYRGVAPSDPYAPAGPLFVDRSDAVWLAEAGQGVNRFTGAGWRLYSNQNPLAKDLLASNDVTAIEQDLDGNMWFGTAASGVTRFDGSTWRIVELDNAGSACHHCGLRDQRGDLWFATRAQRTSRFDGTYWQHFGFGADNVRATLVERTGRMWFAGTQVFQFDLGPYAVTEFTPAPNAMVSALCQDSLGYVWAAMGASVARFNGVAWTSFGDDNTGGVLAGDVTSMVTDPSGVVWFATGGGLATFDGLDWTGVRAPAPGDSRIEQLLIDHQGRLWAAGPIRLERRDGTTWTEFIRDEGVPAGRIQSVMEDREGSLWMSTSDHGAIRFDGEQWGYYTTADGLDHDQVGGIVEDTSGTLWFEFPHRLLKLEPDRTPPRTLLTLIPPQATANRAISVGFAAAGETYGIRFSSSFDGGPWSAWSTIPVWTADGLPDGFHRVEFRARDRIGNVDPTPARVEFEVDATPPEALLATPVPREVLRDSVAIVGTAADARLREYRLELRPGGSPDWSPSRVTLLARGTGSVIGAVLARWDTRNFPDGPYDLRLAVVDTLGLEGSVTVAVTVDNQFPHIDRTSPVLITALSGGDVYTTHGETHLYFPPHAFAEDALVSVLPTAPGSVPDQLPGGAIKVLDGVELAWGSALEKPARFEIGVPDATDRRTLALYHSGDGSSWTRVGGTMEEGARRLSTPVTRPGRYAVFTAPAAAPGDASLSGLVFTPRVFSPGGRFADREVGISFTLGQAAPVTVRVYSLSGRLVREVAGARPMNAGQNLVRWDGRDRAGSVTTDGMYLVTVEALGRVEKKTLAVVR